MSQCVSGPPLGEKLLGIELYDIMLYRTGETAYGVVVSRLESLEARGSSATDDDLAVTLWSGEDPNDNIIPQVGRTLDRLTASAVRPFPTLFLSTMALPADI